MSYQLPPLSDEVEFERLVRDILRRVYDDPGIERFGREGQSQHGIDGFSPADPAITFQCKLKDTRYKADGPLRETLLAEMAEELEKSKGLVKRPRRFIFATTFKNDKQLQERAGALSDESVTVEYWGWDTINEKLWEYAESLIPLYYPLCPVRTVSGFRQITPRLISKAKVEDRDELHRLAIDYYRINDRSELVFRVVCNDMDIRNDRVMGRVSDRLNALPSNATLWILGDGGSGKTTILHRLAVELARREQSVYMLNLETQLSNDDVEAVLSWIKYCSEPGQTALCIDNPAADEETLEVLLRRIPDYCNDIHIFLAERRHRHKALQRAGCLTYLHGEEELEPIFVRNPRDHRQKVYNRLFELLEISEADRAQLRDIVFNERLVYVNATYSVLLELKRKQRIDFDFDWDDYRRSTADLPAFREGYKYIALLYLFGVRTPMTTFSRICGADESRQRQFLETFRGLVNEPVVVDERRDETFRKIAHVRTKHEIISEIFFREHADLSKDELLKEWCEHTDFEDASETQVLINILGAKKNYAGENPHIDFRSLTDFLLGGYLRDKVALSPKLNATAHMAKFWLLLFQDKSDEAVALLESFLETSPEDVHSRTELAKAYLKLGRLGDAETVLLKILDIKPGDLNSRTELAKVFQRQSKVDKAEAVLLELLEIEKHSRWALTELSKVYQRQGRLAEAETALLKVLGIKPNDLQSRTELAKIYQRQNKLSEAETLLLTVLNIKPNDLNSRTELAKVYQRQNKLAEAEAVLMKLLELEPNNLQARTELAKIYQRQGKLPEAEAVLMQSLDIDPQQLHPRTELAKIYQRQNKLAEAEAVLIESLEIDPRQLHPRTELAKIYQRQGRLDEAVTRLEEYIKLDPKGLHPRTELAKIYQRQGRLDEAVRRLEEELILAPDALHPRTELAKIYQRQNKLAEAEAVLMRLLELEPNDLQARTELAKIYQRQGRLDKASASVEETLAIDPLNDHAVSELLAIWRRQGEKEKCVKRFLEFIAQPNYRFSRSSQAPVYRFFQCCRAFRMKEYAHLVFERFKSELDERNLDYYTSNF